MTSEKMTSPTETWFPSGETVGRNDEDGESQGVALPVLEVPIEWMRFCPHCNEVQRFIADRECASGLVGTCANCGDERIAPYTRTTWEAA